MIDCKIKAVYKMKFISKIRVLGFILISCTTAFSQVIETENTYLDKAMDADKSGAYRRAADLCIQGLKETPYDIDLKQLLPL